jgi:hypothetical protein
MVCCIVEISVYGMPYMWRFLFMVCCIVEISVYGMLYSGDFCFYKSLAVPSPFFILVFAFLRRNISMLYRRQFGDFLHVKLTLFRMTFLF